MSMYRYKKGFGLIGIIIVIAIITLLFGRKFFFGAIQQQKSTIQTGLEAEKRAQELKDKIEKNVEQQINK